MPSFICAGCFLTYRQLLWLQKKFLYKKCKKLDFLIFIRKFVRLLGQKKCRHWLWRQYVVTGTIDNPLFKGIHWPNILDFSILTKNPIRDPWWLQKIARCGCGIADMKWAHCTMCTWLFSSDSVVCIISGIVNLKYQLNWVTSHIPYAFLPFPYFKCSPCRI